MKTALSLFTAFSLCIVAVVAAQQDIELNRPADSSETSAVAESETNPNAIRVSLSEDGMLTGMVFKRVDDRQQPVSAKVTISKLNGETLSTDMTEDDGSFRFESIEPGYYTIVGVGSGYYGDQTIDVTSYGEAYTAQVPVEVAPGFDAGATYSSYEAAPIGTFSGGCASGSCGSYGGGGGIGSCGSCGGGRGGLRRFLPLVGLVGLVGLAGDDDDDDASPAM